MLKNTKRNGKFTELPDWTRRQADRPRCELCDRIYRRIYIQPGGPVRLKQVIHHIFARRWLHTYCGEEHAPVNLISLCMRCHGWVTGIEERLFAGDTHGFITGLRTINFPMQRVKDAASHYGLHEVLKWFS
jgi:hypothetical protein